MGVFLGSWNSKCQDLPKYKFSGGGEGTGEVFLDSQNSKCQDLSREGYSWVVKTQSAKICLNLNGGGAFLGSQYSECQDLPKSESFGGGGGGGGDGCVLV